MRYIYYVVAALIFLAVVNLAARFIGNDTQELLSDLNPDQALTEAVDKPAPEPASPPVVSLEAEQLTTTEATTEQVPADINSSTSLQVEQAQTEPAATELRAKSIDAVADAAQIAVDPKTDDVANAVTNKQADTQANVDQSAAVATAPVGQNGQDAQTVSEPAPETVAADTPGTLDTEKVTATIAEAVSEATAAPAVAAEKMTETTKQDSPQPTPPATSTVAVVPAATTDVQAELGEAAQAGEVPPTIAESATSEPEPSLIQSLGDSAGSAATAVVGGAQQAVETVVEAARSLIDPQGEGSELVDSTADKSQQNIADTTEVNEATTEEVASNTAEVAPAEPEISTAAVAEETASASTPATSLIATPQNPEQSATQQATPVVAKKTVTREMSMAPREVLALVDRHPGKVLMIGFFSANCRDCKPSLAWLNEMRREYWAQGLQVIGVNIGTEAQAKSFLQDAPVSFEILHDPERELAAAFWLAAQPSTYLISSSGKLLSMHQGHSSARIGEYEDAIRAALEKR